MVIVKVMGGLGNQLQQYALYRKLESLGREARLDVSWFEKTADQPAVLARRELELNYFDSLRYRAASPDEIRSVLGRLWEEPESVASKIKRKIFPAANPCFEEWDMYHEQVFGFQDKYLTGYWACEKYYADILEKLRREIRFPVCSNKDIRERNGRMIRKMESTESVSVHIRRGDYLDPANRALFGNICTDSYYDTAMKVIRERYPKARYFIFSDDIPYVREHYGGEECEIIDWNTGPDSLYDMMLMSHCRHNICANSTFSFWGARLNDSEGRCMIRPSVHKNTQTCTADRMKELWQGWILITPSGEVL